MRPRRLAILTTHPIQYQAPWFRALAARPELDLQVFFAHDATAGDQSAAGFGVPFHWDVPLLEGYPYRFLKNRARRPSPASFRGMDTPEIAGIIARERYDAVLVLGWHYWSAWQAIWACWRTGTPILMRGDSHLHTPRHPLKKKAKDWLYRLFIPRFDACLAVGSWSRDYYLHYGARPERIFLVPHAVDEQRFADESARWQPERATLRREWGFGEDVSLFVFSGRLVAKKRPLDFIQALGDAAGRGAPVAGLVVGDGPLRLACEDAAQHLGAPVRFSGFMNQSRIVQAYVAGDALVLPSDGGETWGLVVDEAMACGRPAIVSDRVGCGPDLIHPGETGAVFPLGDVHALADTLVSYAHDRGHLLEMGRCARERHARYSLETAVEGVLQAVNAVMADRNGDRAGG